MTMPSMRASRAMAVALLVTYWCLGLAGCSQERSPLDGTQWRLAEWSLSSIDPRDVTITAGFSSGQIAGQSGVNSYGGPYALGPRNSFKVGSLASTEMAGPEPLMRAESAYLALLAQARSYQQVGDRLTLLDANGNELLIFVATRW
jgi:putative lipoprotein